jgi:hypothetical protein
MLENAPALLWLVLPRFAKGSRAGLRSKSARQSFEDAASRASSLFPLREVGVGATIHSGGTAPFSNHLLGPDY